MTKGKTVKPSKTAYTGPWFNEKGKPDPYGLYDKDQYMKRSSAPRDKFEKQAKAPADSDAAKRAGYSR